jgi:hypothetical protein
MWKKTLEQNTNTRFVKFTGKKFLTNTSQTVINYECHRSGNMRPRPNAEEIDTCKLNSRRLSQIRLFVSANEFTAHYFPDHSHEIEISMCPLSKKAQDSVVGMLRGGYSKLYIQKMFEKLPPENRDRFLSLDDIRLISIRNGLSNDGRNHKDDAKSVHIFVENHKEDVILYKPIVEK